MYIDTRKQTSAEEAAAKEEVAACALLDLLGPAKNRVVFITGFDGLGFGL